jgi:hypothetical protein
MSTHGPRFAGVEFLPPKHPMAIKELHLKGVSFGNRQKNLKKLHGDNKNVFVYVQREPKNPHDKNAIRVFAVSEAWNHGPLDIGFVPKEIAAILSPLMDNGNINIHVVLRKTVGGGPRLTWGVVVDLITSLSDQDFEEEPVRTTRKQGHFLDTCISEAPERFLGGELFEFDEYIPSPSQYDDLFDSNSFFGDPFDEEEL